MEWYEIVVIVPIVILGAYLRGKIYDNKNGYHKNDDWKYKKRDRY